MNEIIYLDKEYIINEYEKTHKKAPIKYTKSTTVQAGINIGASIGGTLNESFEYEIRVQDMWLKCKKKLEKIDNCTKLSDLYENKCADIFWIEGIFGINKITNRIGDTIINSYYTFALAQEDCDCKNQLNVLVDNSYFTSGYNQLLSNSNSGTDNFKIKAKMLMKILGTGEKNKYILTPLVIEKTGYYIIKEK